MEASSLMFYLNYCILFSADKTNLDASSNVTRSLSFVPGTPPPGILFILVILFRQ